MRGATLHFKYASSLLDLHPVAITEMCIVTEIAHQGI